MRWSALSLAGEFYYYNAPSVNINNFFFFFLSFVRRSIVGCRNVLVADDLLVAAFVQIFEAFDISALASPPPIQAHRTHAHTHAHGVSMLIFLNSALFAIN